MRRLEIVVVVTFLAGAFGHYANADFYSDNFDTNTSANWNINAPATAGADNLATFNYDYSAVGIPSAPHSVGGTTTGLRMQSNRIGVGSAVYTGFSVSPKLQSFTGDYALHADVWLNYNVPNGSGSGSTQYAGIGVLSDGVSPQWQGTAAAGTPAVTSAFVQVTLDGGNGAASNSDWRAQTPAGVALTSPPYSATGTGIRDNVNAFYTSNFPAVTLAAGNPQATASAGPFPAQVGTTPAGILAFQWHTWSLVKIGTTLTWKVDGVTIATIDLTTAGTTSGTNILLSFSDSNAGKSADATSSQLLFGLFDNVRVDAVPEPSAMLFGGLVCGMVGLVRVFRRDRRQAN